MVMFDIKLSSKLVINEVASYVLYYPERKNVAIWLLGAMKIFVINIKIITHNQLLTLASVESCFQQYS